MFIGVLLELALRVLVGSLVDCCVLLCCLFMLLLLFCRLPDWVLWYGCLCGVVACVVCVYFRVLFSLCCLYF